MSTTKHKEQQQEQAIGHQEQKQGPLSPDPVQEQRQSYKAPENSLASDPITEAPKVEQKKEEKK